MVVHIEAPDEAGHEGRLDKKIAAIEDCDEKVLGTILNGMKGRGDFRILLLPDHPTPIASQIHTAAPVPFILYDSSDERTNTVPFDERAVEEAKLRVPEGHRLIERLFAG